MDIKKKLESKIKDLILDELKEYPSIALMNKGNITIVTNEGLYYSNLDLNDSLLRYIIDKIIVYCFEILIIYKPLYNEKEVDYVQIDNKYIKKLYKNETSKKISNKGYEAINRIETSFKTFDSLYKSNKDKLIMEKKSSKYTLSNFRENVDYPFFSDSFVLNEVPLNYLSKDLNEGKSRKKHYVPSDTKDYIFFLFNQVLKNERSLFVRCEKLISAYKLPKASEIDDLTKNFIYTNSVLPRLDIASVMHFLKILENESKPISEIERDLWRLFLQQVGDMVLFYPARKENYNSLISSETIGSMDLKNEIAEIKKEIVESEKNINRNFEKLNTIYNDYIDEYNKLANSYNKNEKDILITNYILFNSLLHNRFFESLYSSSTFKKILMETDLKRVYNFSSINELDTMILKRDIFNIDFLEMLMLFDIDLNEMEKKQYSFNNQVKSICSSIETLYLNFNLRGSTNYGQYTNDLVYRLIYNLLSRVFYGELNTLLKEILENNCISKKDLIEMYYQTNTSCFESIDNFNLVNYCMKKLTFTLKGNFAKKNSYINNFIISFLLYSNCYNRKFNGNTSIEIKRGEA